MKKRYKGLIGIAVLIALIAVTAFVVGGFSKAKWDRISEEHARKVVEGFPEFGREQFERYWGGILPGTPEQREMMIEWATQFGSLQGIERIERVNYLTKVTIRGGVSHSYIYDVYADYSNSPLVIRLWFKVHDQRLDVINMTINPVQE